MLEDLLNFRDEALLQKKETNENYLKIWKELFEEKYPDIQVNERLLHARLSAYERSCSIEKKEDQSTLKKSIHWTKEMVEDLKTLKDEASYLKDSTQSGWEVMTELFQEKYPDLEITKSMLKSRYYAYHRPNDNSDHTEGEDKYIENAVETRERIHWTKEMLEDLSKFHDQVVLEKDNYHGGHFSCFKRVTDLFRSNYPNIRVTPSLFHSRLYQYKRCQGADRKIKENIGQIEKDEVKCSTEDDVNQNIDEVVLGELSHSFEMDVEENVDPIVIDNSHVTSQVHTGSTIEHDCIHLYKLGAKHSNKPVFNSVCANCGQLLFGELTGSNSHRFPNKKGHSFS